MRFTEAIRLAEISVDTMKAKKAME